LLRLIPSRWKPELWAAIPYNKIKIATLEAFPVWLLPGLNFERFIEEYAPRVEFDIPSVRVCPFYKRRG